MLPHHHCYHITSAVGTAELQNGTENELWQPKREGPGRAFSSFLSLSLSPSSQVSHRHDACSATFFTLPATGLMVKNARRRPVERGREKTAASLLLPVKRLPILSSFSRQLPCSLGECAKAVAGTVSVCGGFGVHLRCPLALFISLLPLTATHNARRQD